MSDFENFSSRRYLILPPREIGDRLSASINMDVKFHSSMHMMKDVSTRHANCRCLTCRWTFLTYTSAFRSRTLIAFAVRISATRNSPVSCENTLLEFHASIDASAVFRIGRETDLRREAGIKTGVISVSSNHGGSRGSAKTIPSRATAKNTMIHAEKRDFSLYSRGTE